MVAVLTVFANHLWDWPRGGFVGVDVFFVISGFLITGNLLRAAETKGNVSFRYFYKKRALRIIPAATVVLVLTYVASMLVFLPFRSQQVGLDAVTAFFFFSNWRFAIEGTDYFAVAANTVSPLQHYWSLSIEEQFYFVWPALIFVIGLVVARRAWDHRHRMQLAGAVMATIIAASLGWALYETAISPTWAYFNTFSRVWELGVGALLATAVGVLARIPEVVKPLLSWAGLALIAASLILIADDSSGFPAPWALLPVSGAALVIAAGVGGEPNYQAFLRNPVSCYIGDISYSLYLVHWPIIIFAAELMDGGAFFNLVVITSAFGLAILSYHFIETPLRSASYGSFHEALRGMRRRQFDPSPSNRYAAIGALGLVLVALVAYSTRPDAYKQPTAPPVIDASEVDPSGPQLQVGPLGTALQEEIVTALQATGWPKLDPSIETVVQEGLVDTPILPCDKGSVTIDLNTCTFGSSSAPRKILLAGDSVAIGYAGPLREIVMNSGGQVQLIVLPMASCEFTTELIESATLAANCSGRKQFVVDTINAVKPEAVIIANLDWLRKVVGAQRPMTPGDWSESLEKLIEQFRPSTKHVVLMSSPPGEVDIKECFGKRSHGPADCVGKVTKQWNDIATVERALAEKIGGAWIDSRTWFCSTGRLCPAFAGVTPTKYDEAHLAPAYGRKIYPVIAESFQAAGVPLS